VVFNIYVTHPTALLYNKEYKRRHPISLIHIIRSNFPGVFFPTYPILLMLNTNPREIHKNKTEHAFYRQLVHVALSTRQLR